MADVILGTMFLFLFFGGIGSIVYMISSYYRDQNKK